MRKLVGTIVICRDPETVWAKAALTTEHTLCVRLRRKDAVLTLDQASMNGAQGQQVLGRRLGIAILTARVNRNLSREALSELIYHRYNEEITPKTIGRVESGRTNPTMKTLSLLIASLLDDDIRSLEDIALTLFQMGEHKRVGEPERQGFSTHSDANELTDE